MNEGGDAVHANNESACQAIVWWRPVSVVEKETPCYMYGKEKACLLSDLHSPVHTSQSFSATLTGHCPILRRLSCLHERPRRDGQKRCQWLARRKSQKFGMGASWAGLSHLR